MDKLFVNPRREVVEEMQADFTSHHIEGIAREGNIAFTAPLISHVVGNLWQGGCINGVNLGGKFKHVISLYPWERYNPGAELDSFIEVRLYDGKTVPDEAQLEMLAQWINNCLKHGPTLVHCQAGLNRSGLLAGLSLIRSGMEPAAAIALLRSSRSPAVLCNKAFENWLLALAKY
jgi:Dual specificity phosphatase, catalytic domain